MSVRLRKSSVKRDGSLNVTNKDAGNIERENKRFADAIRNSPAITKIWFQSAWYTAPEVNKLIGRPLHLKQHINTNEDIVYSFDRRHNVAKFETQKDTRIIALKMRRSIRAIEKTMFIVNVIEMHWTTELRTYSFNYTAPRLTDLMKRKLLGESSNAST